MSRLCRAAPCVVLVLLGVVVGCGRKPKPPAAADPAAPADPAKPREVRGWGPLIDPVGDCVMAEDGEKLTLTVPAGNRNLSTAINTSAPRLLREVEGDFTAVVKVTGEFDPGTRGVEATPFNGAGLLVWADERNFVRVERNSYWLAGRQRFFCYPPLVEYFKGGAGQNTNPDPTEAANFFTGWSTHLRVDRRGDRLTASYSHDGTGWTGVKEFSVEMPPKVFVGVAAVNTAAQPFNVQFEGLSVTVFPGK